MAFKLIAIVLSVLAVYGNCACTCGGNGGSGSNINTAGTISISVPSLTCPGPAAPKVSVSSGPTLTLPAPSVSYPASPSPSGCSSGNDGSNGCGNTGSLPSSIACPSTPAPQINQEPDVELALPFPAEIPLGQYCNCQKYVIRPKIVPCA